MMGKGARASALATEELVTVHNGREPREETARTVVQLSKFFGEPGEDVEKWLKSFERVTKANNWSPRRQRDIIPAFLREPAAEFYDELHDDTDLDDLKTALIQQFMPKEARRFYYADLYGRKQGESESAADFGREIQQLVRRAHSEVPGEHQDTLMREHFVNGLRPELKRIVLISDPKSFTRAVEVAKREEINEQVAHGTAPWVKPNRPEYGRQQFASTTTAVAAISGEQLTNDRLARLESVVEKLAISVASLQVPRPERRQWRSENQSRNLRCSDGRPICNFCQRVGHIESRCHQKNGVAPQQQPEGENSKN
eukprot:gene13535-biopygen10802